jgi:hypothetical protein
MMSIELVLKLSDLTSKQIHFQICLFHGHFTIGDAYRGRLTEGRGIKKFVVCMREEKTNDVRPCRGGGVRPLHTNVARHLL